MRSCRAMAAQSVPVPDTTPEEEFDLFGPGPGPGTAPAASGAAASSNPFVSEAPASSAAPQAGSSPTGGVQAGGSPSGVGTAGEGDQTALLVGLLRQSLQQNQQMMQQNQQLVATMLRRMDLEEERRNKAEEKVAETAEAAKKAAEAALTRDPFDPRAAASSVDPGDKSSGGSFGSSNRAEKYLPPLPLIDHHVMGKGRMKEVEGWHTFLETLSSWLALQEEAFVRELQLCVPVKTEIVQTKLPSDTAARSSKLFYYLTQSLAKWERGLELLRSCSKRQGMSACGYEVVRTITSQYSIVSRMEAVYVRDSALKLFQSVGGIKRPTDLIRHLEDAFAKSESKLTNFPELKLSEADRCSVLLQSLSAEVRQYVVLHGKSDDWEALRKSLTYYEEQLRLCDLPGAGARALSDVLCDYCGKKGHKAEQCWQKKRDERNAAGGPGKGKGDYEKKGKGRGDQTPKGARTPRGSEKGKGDKGKGEKGKEKGKDKWKKGPKGPKKPKKGKEKGRSLTEPESEEESGGGATVMALRFSAPAGGRPSPLPSGVPVLSPSEKPSPADVASQPAAVRPNGPTQREEPASESMGSLGTRFAKQGDVNHVCKALEATAGDVWLVDSGATCHIVSTQHLSGFRVVKKHERTANLFNASGGSIVVSGVVDLEVHFGDVFLRLEEVLVAEVGFNVISPWTASERGWKTFLAKGGSRLYKGNKKSIKLMGAQRAWWAVSGSKKNPKRQPKGAVPMEIDSISEGPKPGRFAGIALTGPAPSGQEAPPGILKNRRKEAEYEIEAPGAQNPLSGTPFSFLFRGLVSDLVVSGPSEAPVFRDETPEVHEVPSGEPSLLRKEHDLEVVEHGFAHDFSEACLDSEFFPERPKAFRKLWHGVSMFELVRKPCSLNFGMFGMTLLLAAVFACFGFGPQGVDGQFVAYRGNGSSAACGRNGSSTACGRDCTSTAYGRDGTSTAYGRGGTSLRTEWFYRGASCDFSESCWSYHGWSGELGERVHFGEFPELCRPCGGTGGSVCSSSPGAFTWGRSFRSFACCGTCPERSGRRRSLGSLESTGSRGRLFQTPPSWGTSWECCSCEPGASASGGRAEPFETSFPAGGICEKGRRGGPWILSPAWAGGARTPPFPLPRHSGYRSDARRSFAQPYKPVLPHHFCFGRRRPPSGCFGRRRWYCWAQSYAEARRVRARNAVYACTPATLPGRRPCATRFSEITGGSRDNHRERVGRMGILVVPCQTRPRAQGVGAASDGCRRRPRVCGGMSPSRILPWRTMVRQKAAKGPSGVAHRCGHSSVFEEVPAGHRRLRPRAKRLPGAPFGAQRGRSVRKTGRINRRRPEGWMAVPVCCYWIACPTLVGQKAAEKQEAGLPYCPGSTEAKGRLQAKAGEESNDTGGKLRVLLVGELVRGVGRVPLRGGRSCGVDRHPPLSGQRDALAARSDHQNLWYSSSAGSPLPRGEYRRRLFLGNSHRSSGRSSRRRIGRSSRRSIGRSSRKHGWRRDGEPWDPQESYEFSLGDPQTGNACCPDSVGRRRHEGAASARYPAKARFAASAATSCKGSVYWPTRADEFFHWTNRPGEILHLAIAQSGTGCRLRVGGGSRKGGDGGGKPQLVIDPEGWFLKKKIVCEHVWLEGFEWHVFGMDLGMNVSLFCACFGSLGNREAQQSLQALTFPSLLCLPSSRVRTPAMFLDVVAATLFAGLLFAWSLLSGIVFCWCSLVLQFFRKFLRRRGLRTKRFRAKGRRKEICFRMKCQGRWVRVWTQRHLVIVRREKVGCSFLPGSMLRKFLLFLHVFLGMFGMFGMLVHVCERGNDEQPQPAKAEVSEHRLRAMHRGLPLPGSGTSADPLNLDPVDPYDPEGLLEPPAGLHERGRPPPQPERIVDPTRDSEEPGDETEDLRVPLSSFSLHRHRCNGHFPFDENCTACCSSKGRVPARRLRRKLQRENQTVGLDFFYFGKLRVLLVMHLGSRYTLCLPAPELSDDLAFNLTRALKECGLSGKAVTFRLDNEASLVALVERTARHRACTASAVITDVVPGYRPQSKGSIEKQVDVMKSGFWAIWLDLEAQINQAQPPSDGAEGIKLPLGGLLWQACIFYTARCFNLWSSSPGNSSVSLDRLHEEYVQKSRTRAFGSVCQARVARSKAHLQRYRGARTVKIVYLGPVHARGGGVYGVPLNSKDIDVFPAIAAGKDETAIDVPTLLGLASEKPLALDDQDPERPTLFEPREREEEGEGFPQEGVDADGDEEMIQDDEGLGDYSPSLPPSDGDTQEVIDNEGDMEVDMSIDWLTSHLLERVFQGPELRASSSEVSQSFTLKFGGSRICCKVPQHALSETSGEPLSPDLLYLSMKLELEELEAFGVGEVIPEYEARKEARSSGRRVLTSRWVNSVKKPGLYRSRLVVRDYASMGGTTLAEGIYSPTTSLEGLRVLLSLLCKRGSVLSCDVSVAFMHAAVSRPEYVELPSNVSIAASKGPLEAGAKVYLRLKKAMNGLRSAPLSWYQELSSYLRGVGFEPSLDPTIFRRKTAKGLTVVLFYVDDLLIYSEDPKEGRKVFEDLQKRYKLKLTGELLEDIPGEVSFLGRRIFRRRGGDRRVYFGLAANYLDSCCEEFGITKPSPKLVSLEKRYAELLKKGLTEAISPAAHERYRRTLGRLAWAALSRPDLQFVCGFLGRHQAGPNEAAESCMRDVLRWVKGLPHKVQVFPSSREILEEDADAEAISCFTDASWSLNSVSGGILTWENCALKSFSRKQSTTALSSAEAELAALTEVAREGLYIALLVETVLEGVPKDREHGYYVLKGYSDSESAVCISKMSTLLRKVRHIELRAAFLQELVAKGRFTVEHVPGAINPADSLTKSPTTSNLSSLYDVSGLVDEPGAWEDDSKHRSSVSFDIEPNPLEDPDFPEVPNSWLGSAQKVAKQAASLIVVELCCEEGSALAKACSGIPEVAYFGVTKEIDLLSYNGLCLLKEVFGVLSSGTVRVYAHLSTPCSAGCGLRHLRFKKGGKALEKWRAALAVHKRSWRRIGKLLSPYKDSERLLLSHEWPEKSGLWGETVFKGVAKKLSLEHGCLVDRCCFEKGKDRPWKRWWFLSNSPQFIWRLSESHCDGGHDHHQLDLPESGLYPARLGKTLVEAALKEAGARQRTRA